MNIIVILFDILFIIVVIILKSYLLLWLANHKKWENNLQKSILTNIYWLLIMLGISLVLIITLPMIFSALVIDYLNNFFWFTFINLGFFAINFIIGYLLMSYIYNGSHIDSFIISLILIITEKTVILVIEALTLIIFSTYLFEGIYVFSPY